MRNEQAVDDAGRIVDEFVGVVRLDVAPLYANNGVSHSGSSITVLGCNLIEKHRRAHAKPSVRNDNPQGHVNIGIHESRGFKHSVANWNENA